MKNRTNASYPESSMYPGTAIDMTVFTTIDRNPVFDLIKIEQCKLYFSMKKS